MCPCPSGALSLSLSRGSAGGLRDAPPARAPRPFPAPPRRALARQDGGRPGAPLEAAAANRGRARGAGRPRAVGSLRHVAPWRRACSGVRGACGPGWDTACCSLAISAARSGTESGEWKVENPWVEVKVERKSYMHKQSKNPKGLIHSFQRAGRCSAILGRAGTHHVQC